MQLKSNPAVEEKFYTYPDRIQLKMQQLRQLILDVAEQEPSINELEETLKWGEPSYLAPKGSTIRIDWKVKAPEQYAIYFKCTSKLVPTFKEIYGDTFAYEKNRAILLQVGQEVPKTALRHCIGLALTYHQIKHLPLLGAKQ